MVEKAPILRNYLWNERTLIGQGSYSNVYRVRRRNKGTCDTILDQFVAIKEITVKKAEGVAELIKNEIELLKKVSHENIVQLLDFQIYEDMAYMVLQYCQLDLRGLMQQNKGKLTEHNAIRVLVQIVKGMKEVRKHGFAHRDLKPENILIKAGVVKICDFGLAVYCKDGSKLLRYCGTPFYMAPQIVWKKYYTSKADIWSLGTILYEMIFGYTPWACRDENSYKNNIKQNSLRFPFDVPIGHQTRDFIVGCLQLEEEFRMGWQDIYGHPLIKKEDGGELTHYYKMDLSLMAILKELQLKYYTDAKNVEDVFMEHSYEKEMNIIEFYQSYRQFYPISFKQNRLLFEQADINNDGRVSYEELIKILRWYDFDDGQDIPSKIIRDIRNIVRNNNIEVGKLFQQSDLNKNGTLDLTELETLIRIVAPNIISYDVRRVFDRIDLDQDGRISRLEVEIMLNEQRTKQKSRPSHDLEISREVNLMHSKMAQKGVSNAKVAKPERDESTKETFTARRKNSQVELAQKKLPAKPNERPEVLKQKPGNNKDLRTLLNYRNIN